MNTGQEIIDTTYFEQFSPPTIFRVGAAVDPIKTDKQHLILSLQLNHPVDNAEYIVTGIEYSFVKTLFFRAGYKFNKNEENFTFFREGLLGNAVYMNSTALTKRFQEKGIRGRVCMKRFHDDV